MLDNNSFEITTDGRTRTVGYSDTDGETFIDVEITGKEAIDVLNALEQFAEEVDSGRFETDLPVERMLNMTHGGAHWPNDCSVMITANDEARVLLHALARYEPDSEPDFTRALREAFIVAMEDSSIDFDTEALRKLHPAIPGRQSSLSNK